jgi:hypothetical protein
VRVLLDERLAPEVVHEKLGDGSVQLQVGVIEDGEAVVEDEAARERGGVRSERHERAE